MSSRFKLHVDISTIEHGKSFEFHLAEFGGYSELPTNVAVVDLQFISCARAVVVQAIELMKSPERFLMHAPSANFSISCSLDVKEQVKETDKLLDENYLIMNLGASMPVFLMALVDYFQAYACLVFSSWEPKAE